MGGRARHTRRPNLRSASSRLLHTAARAELARFLLRAHGLSGPLAPRGAAAEAIARLGMVQIDSIRSTGLRNQELAWLARAEGDDAALEKGEGGKRRRKGRRYDDGGRRRSG